MGITEKGGEDGSYSEEALRESRENSRSTGNIWGECVFIAREKNREEGKNSKGLEEPNRVLEPGVRLRDCLRTKWKESDLRFSCSFRIWGGVGFCSALGAFFRVFWGGAQCQHASALSSFHHAAVWKRRRTPAAGCSTISAFKPGSSAGSGPATVAKRCRMRTAV